MDDGVVVDWEGLCSGVLVLLGIDEKEQLAKSVAVGLTSVMMFVTITGTDTVVSSPICTSIRQVLDKQKTNAGRSVRRKYAQT